jgi:transporter family-2 protein
VATTGRAAAASVVPPVLLAALTGGFVAVQGRLNGDLSAAGAGPLVASWACYVVTVATLVVVVLARGRGPATWRLLRRDARWWWFAVGLCGVPIVVTFAFGIPVVGVAIASVCSVAGQTVGGLALDARGVGVPAPLRLTPQRLLAGIGAVAGLALAIGSGAGGSPSGVARTVGLGVLMFLGGMLITGQQAGNGRVTGLTGDPMVPGVTSAVGGTAGLTVLVAVAAAAGGLHGVGLPGPARWVLYLGGPLGAAITVVAAWAVRRLGTFALSLTVVVGQMVTAVGIDLAGGAGVRWPTYAAIVVIAGATALAVRPARPRTRRPDGG